MVTPYRVVNIFLLEACVLIIQIYAPLIVRHKFPLAMYAFNLNDVPIEITNKTVVRAVRGRVLFVMAIDLCNRVAALAQKINFMSSTKEQIFLTDCFLRLFRKK